MKTKTFFKGNKLLTNILMAQSIYREVSKSTLIIDKVANQYLFSVEV